MRALLLGCILVGTGCTAEAGTAAAARLGDEITLFHAGPIAVAFTGFVVEGEAGPQPLYFGMLTPGGQPLLSDAPPPTGQTLRLRFRPTDASQVVQLGELRMVGATLMTLAGVGADEFAEIEPAEGTAEHLYRGGPLRLTVEVVDGEVVLRE